MKVEVGSVSLALLAACLVGDSWVCCEAGTRGVCHVSNTATR